MGVLIILNVRTEKGVAHRGTAATMVGHHATTILAYSIRSHFGLPGLLILDSPSAVNVPSKKTQPVLVGMAKLSSLGPLEERCDEEKKRKTNGEIILKSCLGKGIRLFAIRNRTYSVVVVRTDSAEHGLIQIEQACLWLGSS